jgi:hypothetical protein
MMVCGIMTIAILLAQLAPGWHSGIIAAVLLFIAIDRLYTHRQLRSLALLSSEWLIAVGAHWIVIVLLIRLLLSYANGVDSFLADLSLAARGYFAELFTLEFVITFLFAFVVWILTAQFLDVLDEIGLDEERAAHEEPPPIQSDVVPAHQRLVTLIFSLGIALVILTVLTRLDMRTILENVRGLPAIQVSRFSGAEAGALLYFVFGLALLSLSRLMSLQTRWNRVRIPVSSGNLVRQWGIHSVVFLLLLAVVISLLPAGDSLGFLSVLGTLFGFLLGVFIFLSQAILALLLFLFSIPFLLLGAAPPLVGGAGPTPFPVLPTQPILPTTSSALWGLVRSILLWGLLAVIVVFALIHFVRGHGDLRAALRKSRVASWLVLVWQWLSKSVERTRVTLVGALAQGWQTVLSRLEAKRLLPPASLIRLRALDPRRQIYFFYLAMIRRGGEQGVTRRPSQTPSEYAEALEKALPSAGGDIESITEAFVQARYSRRDVDSGQANAVKAAWGRLRRALRSKSRTTE